MQFVNQPEQEQPSLLGRLTGVAYWQLFRLCRWIVFEVASTHYAELEQEFELGQQRTAREVRGDHKVG